MQNLSKIFHIREAAWASPEFDQFSNKLFSLPFSLSSLVVFSIFLSPPLLLYLSPDLSWCYFLWWKCLFPVCNMLVTSSSFKTDDDSGDLLGQYQWILFIHWIQYANGLNSSPLWKWPWILQTFPSIFLTLFWSTEEEWIDGPRWFQSLLNFNGLWFGMNFKKQWQLILLTAYNINHSNTEDYLNWQNTNDIIYTTDTSFLFLCFFSIFKWLKRKLKVKIDTGKPYSMVHCIVLWIKETLKVEINSY